MPTSTVELAEPTVAPAGGGRDLFLSKGCAACHGQDAEGSGIAPALPGHTDEQITRQVRSPIGNMPGFSDDQISDHELEEIIRFITGLESGNGHSEPVDLTMDDVIAMHHWMAILALKADAVAEAIHHVEHANALIENQDHLEQMQMVLEDLGAGRLHDAEHTLEDMLAGVAEPELSMEELHLQLALSGLAAHDVVDAQHHVDHFMEEAGYTEQEAAKEIMSHLESGRLHEAEQAVIELLEGMPHQHHHH
ncbi:MAG: c-type cytochrome [Dehalococcoidia bacterium]